MMRQLALGICAAVLLIGTTAAAAPGADDLRALEAARSRALTSNDFEALDVILADDLVFTHANGARQSKAELFLALRSKGMRYVSLETRDVDARVHGGAGIVTGLALIVVEAGGEQRSLRVLFTAVYAEVGGRTQLVAYQSTRAQSTSAQSTAAPALE